MVSIRKPLNKPPPSKPASLVEHLDPLIHATVLVQSVCEIAGSRHLIADLSADFAELGLDQALRRRDSKPLFEWLLEIFSYQGISDQVAATFISKHGIPSWQTINAGLNPAPTCPRLTAYWTFEGYRYDKGSYTCAEPEHLDACPLPRHSLRNGRLNQTAYSLFLFIRDVAEGDLSAWIDDQIADASDPGQASESLIEPLRHIFGVSDKVLTMTLSGLLLGAGTAKPNWFAVGANMIAIDTLVHNFLHRTGILSRLGADHPYGPRCYAEDGCAAIIRTVSAAIDARQFNRDYPSDFPRFVQHAVWRFCAAGGLNICNGTMIDDAKPCQNLACRLSEKCDHVTLRSAKKPK